MPPHVRREVSRRSERSSALWTLIRSLLTVYAHVYSESMRVSCGPPALSTQVRFFPCMDAFMFDEGTTRRETLGAHGTSKLFFVGVSQHVSLQVSLMFVSLMARLTNEVLLIAVQLHMLDQVALMRKRLLTDFTLMRLLVGMSLSMLI